MKLGDTVTLRIDGRNAFLVKTVKYRKAKVSRVTATMIVFQSEGREYRFNRKNMTFKDQRFDYQVEIIDDGDHLVEKDALRRSILVDIEGIKNILNDIDPSNLEITTDEWLEIREKIR